VPSTVAEERATNPFLRPGSPTIRRAVGCEEGAYAEVFAATRALKDRKLYRSA
jgi:hydroxyacylglutathione hydrolase